MKSDSAPIRLPVVALKPGPTLHPWDVSPAVAEAQELLCAHGYSVVADGDFNWKTETAVKYYQKRYGLRIDGIIGPQTWRSLKATVAPGKRILQEGRSGADVYELQGLLQVQGYSLKRDGVFGRATKTIVMDFQCQHHLEPDGKVNSVTWALLGERLPIMKRRTATDRIKM